MPVLAQECATCGEPADMSRTSTGELQDSGSAEVVGSTGMRLMMVMRMSIPLTSRSSFLWSDTIDNVKAKSRTNQQLILCSSRTRGLCQIAAVEFRICTTEV